MVEKGANTLYCLLLPLLYLLRLFSAGSFRHNLRRSDAVNIASSLQLIDVTNSGVETHPGRSSSGLRLAQPNPFSPRSSTPGSVRIKKVSIY